MIDLPAGWQANVLSFDISSIGDFVSDMVPLIDIVRDTWNKETLTELAEGKIFVADAVLNNILKERIKNDDHSPLKNITVTSAASGKLTINATMNNNKSLLLEGMIEEFVKDADKTRIVYNVTKHKMPGSHNLTAFVFKNLSLSTTQKLFGNLRSVTAELPVEVKHNKVAVNLTDVLAASRFASAVLPDGQKLIDTIEIEGARVKEGGLEIDTKFVGNSEQLRGMLRRILGN